LATVKPRPQKEKAMSRFDRPRDVDTTSQARPPVAHADRGQVPAGEILA
jgi:hypothetical protein